jgi:hypothetical protein
VTEIQIEQACAALDTVDHKLAIALATWMLAKGLIAIEAKTLQTPHWRMLAGHAKLAVPKQATREAVIRYMAMKEEKDND